MTRSMGDQDGMVAGIISVPEITHVQLINASKILIIASDGVW
jgi:serine/threonine protein phosphatase PrpC